MIKKLILILLFIITLITGCSPVSQQSFKANDPLIFAVVYPVEEIDNSTGFWQGIELAVKEINENGGIKGRTISVIKKDDKGSVTEGLAIAQSLAESKEIAAVIGHWNSRVTVPAAAVYEDAGKLMITPASTSPKIGKGYNYIFQQIIDDAQIGQAIAWFTDKINYKRIAVFYADDEYGRGLVNAFTNAADKYEINIIDRISMLGSDLNVKRIVQKWEALDIEAVFVADVLPQAGITIKKLTKAGLSVPILGATGLDRTNFISKYGNFAKEVYFPVLFNPYDKRPEVQRFTNAYQEQIQQLPDSWAAQAYDTVKILAEGISKANSSASDDIVDALHNISDWSGVTGQLSFNQDGEISGKKLYFKVIKAGKINFLQELELEKGVN